MMNRGISVLLALSLATSACYACNQFGPGGSAASGQSRRLQPGAARSAAASPGGPQREPVPATILGSPAKIVSQVADATFSSDEHHHHHHHDESARSSSHLSQYATYGEDPDKDAILERSDDLDVSESKAEEISNILAQLGDAPEAIGNSNTTTLVETETKNTPFDGCCWKIKVDFTEGHGFYGAYKIHSSMFGNYIMEPGLVNGKQHYTSSDPYNEGVYAVAFCGGQWWIQPSRLRGQCNGYANSGLSDAQCVNEIDYTWAYYVPPINQFVLAKKGMSIWCSV